VSSIYSRCVNAELPIEQVIGASYSWCSSWAAELKELFATYVEAKQKRNVLDYDDLLLYWAQMVADAGLADDIGGGFDHVLVDEYQDTNRVQARSCWRSARRPRPDRRRRRHPLDLLVPRRDRAQHPLLSRQFSPPATIITLDRNYRSTQTILAAVNGVIGLAKERFTKNLWTERTSAAKPQLVSLRDEADQARFIVERVLENRESGTPLKEQAALFRTSSHSGPIEIELTRRNILFVKFCGLKFLDAAHTKDMLALLRFVENPRDRVAGFRLLHLLPGVGSATAQRVLDRMGGRRPNRGACWYTDATARRRTAGHQHSKHVVAALARLAEAGDPLPASIQLLRRIRTRAQSRDEEKGRGLVRARRRSSADSLCRHLDQVQGRPRHQVQADPRTSPRLWLPDNSTERCHEPIHPKAMP
jgi:superfamily I DNA/RNA helicase